METVHKVGSKFGKDPRVHGEFVQGRTILYHVIAPEYWDVSLLLNLYNSNPVEHTKRRRTMAQLFSRSKITQLER